jgi:heme/copper-type cytochrome/quinol oxidase subunit 4
MVASPDETRRDARLLLAVWIALVGLTLGSFWLADTGEPSASGATTWVLAFATLKSHLIAGIFMEMRRGPRAWAAVMSGFLLVEAALIVAILG